MKCGVKFCGGCNPRYERGAAYREIKEQLKKSVDFAYAEDDVTYDNLLVIGGCTACCASYSQYTSPGQINGNPLNVLCEKVCVQVKKVFDACMQQSQLNDIVLDITNLTP